MGYESTLSSNCSRRIYNVPKHLIYSKIEYEIVLGTDNKLPNCRHCLATASPLVGKNL